MALSPGELPPAALEFMRERHLATLTTLRRDGSPHVVPVGFTWDDEALVARVITSRRSAKALQARAGRRAALGQVDGRRWLTLEGPTRVVEDPAAVRDAEERYALRYRTPAPQPAAGRRPPRRRPRPRGLLARPAAPVAVPHLTSPPGWRARTWRTGQPRAPSRPARAGRRRAVGGPWAAPAPPR